MSRTPFILGTTVICVAATVAAIRLLSSGDTAGGIQAVSVEEASSPKHGEKSSQSPQQSHPVSRAPRPANSVPTTSITLGDAIPSGISPSKLNRVHVILARTEKDCVKTLANLTQKYELTGKQRAAIYPLIAAHHPDAHPAMLIGGSSLPSVASGKSLDESIYPFLTPEQQDLLADSALDHDAWWSEIASQLQSDLTSAMAGGEVAPPQPAASQPGGAIGIVPSAGVAPGDGEASSHDGGNLFDLLNGN